MSYGDLAEVTLLDCTLRDGSYVNNFRFSGLETEEIVGALSLLNVPLIEVGHGIGLGASRLNGCEAAETDIEYIERAVSVKRKSKVGVFCIPGVGSIDDLRLAIDAGIEFVRIGADVSKVNSMKEYIEFAADQNISVYANFMKSYVLQPAELAKLALQAQSFGATGVYLVDSAGGMLPDDVREYTRSLLDAVGEDCQVGFHGHNNLGLAVANALASIEEGASIVDTSLQGLGRSSGNAATELVVGCMQKNNRWMSLDAVKFLQVSENLVRHHVQTKGICSFDAAAGIAMFHSSYMPTVIKHAQEYGVDPRAVIIELCNITQISAPEELIVEICKSLPVLNPRMFVADRYFGNEESLDV